jgi:hypothetical protein
MARSLHIRDSLGVAVKYPPSPSCLHLSVVEKGGKSIASGSARKASKRPKGNLWRRLKSSWGGDIKSLKSLLIKPRIGLYKPISFEVNWVALTVVN